MARQLVPCLLEAATRRLLAEIDSSIRFGFREFAREIRQDGKER